MKPVFLKIVWSVKLRAAGITFGSYSGHQSVPLPPVFQLVESVVHTAYSYNDHGVTIAVSLSDTAA